MIEKYPAVRSKVAEFPPPLPCDWSVGAHDSYHADKIAAVSKRPDQK